jgi:putative redox protein
MTTITAEQVGDYRIDITNGTHVWRADEPVDLGGDNTGPNPYDYLLGSLAACTTITLTMYAKRKNIKIRSLSVSYTFDRVHINDCEKCDDSKSGLIDRVTSEIFIDGDFDDQTRKRLEDIAQRCPVHKTLEKGIHFEETAFVG